MKCDVCRKDAELECSCRRCASEPDEQEKFYACTGCMNAVSDKHLRVRGVFARWNRLDMLINIRDTVRLQGSDTKGTVLAPAQHKLGAVIVEWENGTSSTEYRTSLLLVSELEETYQQIAEKLSQVSELLSETNDLVSKTGKNLLTLVRDGEVDVSALEQFMEDSGMTARDTSYDSSGWESSQKCW